MKMIKNFPYQWDEELCLRSTDSIESVGSHWWPFQEQLQENIEEKSPKVVLWGGNGREEAEKFSVHYSIKSLTVKGRWTFD